MTDVFKGDAAWLRSDGQLMSRIKQASHKKGVELSVTMPDGSTLKGIYAKMNAETMIQFCTAARGHYIEQQAEQKAKKARATFEREMADDDRAAAKDVPTAKENVGLDYLDKEAVAARCVKLARSEASARDTARACKQERLTLLRIVEVLEDAQENCAETPASEDREAEKYAEERSLAPEEIWSKQDVQNFKKALKGEDE